MRRLLFAGLLAAAHAGAQATDIGVVGLFPNKAVLVVDGGAPKTYAVGSTVADGVRLVAVDGSSATVDVRGRRQTIEIGGVVGRQAASEKQSVTIAPDARGHYVVEGQINGGSVQMLLDTGATLIALPAADARRLGIDYRKGRIGYLNTANGVTTAYQVKLDTVKVGEIELHQVDAIVQEQGLPFVLLGMSFLNRTEMRRTGQQMVLTKRF